MCCMVLRVCYLGKGKIIKIVKRLVLLKVGGWGGMNRWSSVDFGGRMILYRLGRSRRGM